MIKLSGELEIWPMSVPFSVARRSVNAVQTMTVVATEGSFSGRGESSGLYYKGETPEVMIRDLAKMSAIVSDQPLNRALLRTSEIGPGLRNAIDCALWDLEAKQTGQSVAQLLGFDKLLPVQTFYTISKNDPGSMAERAKRQSVFRRLKIKVGGEGDIALDLARISAVRAAVDDSVTLLVDPNSSWTADMLVDAWPALIKARVNIVEQPTPPGNEPRVQDVNDRIVICADEAVETSTDISSLHPIYRMVNIKLDKSGGLTGGMELLKAANGAGLQTMIGCMNGTSLAMAPAIILAQKSDYADLDAPIDLVRDREFACRYSGDMVAAPPSAFWGN
jgi:L-Ala-D/L-Glu epimerase